MNGSRLDPPTRSCVDREPSDVCERCGQVLGPADGYLPSNCIDLEAREDRAREIYQKAAMEQAGGSVAQSIRRRRQ
ncbi:hypothetical protein GCM10008171_33870 [Methylopila jiangsuensis]|uniref:Uncharacterized protein n=1 Tax=Methylopila jiangsuensis TaxID=586230 RepID=A0A9W6N594_9HYPH|nr:hypothetical protein GCM10008171_33870 [Methylopila jiangsuensis]